MSFGANNTSKTAENNLSGTSNLALNSLFPAAFNSGNQAVNTGLNTAQTGLNTAQPGINFLNTLAGGNQANTTAALQPNINQIQGGTASTLNAINTLMPRGGGRSGALFSQSFAPQSQIQNLFNNARTSANTALPGIGFQQAGIGLGDGQLGSSLFGNAASGLNSANSANSTLGNFGFTQQQISDQLDAAIASGLFGLATTPLGGGGSKSLLGILGVGRS